MTHFYFSSYQDDAVGYLQQALSGAVQVRPYRTGLGTIVTATTEVAEVLVRVAQESRW